LTRRGDYSLEAGPARPGRGEERADIARQQGITRARVTQVLGLLKFVPELQQRILELPPTTTSRPVSKRALRPLAQLPHPQQPAQFGKLIQAQ
jgi:hypothetical protein